MAFANIVQRGSASAMLLAAALLSCSCGAPLSVSGEVLLSSRDWNHIRYFNGVTFRDVMVRQPVSEAKVGPNRHVYVLTGFVWDDAGKLINNTVAELRADGSVAAIFSQPKTKLSFSATPTVLVVLANAADEKKCPTLFWIRYDGTVLKTMPAPCSTFDPEAYSGDNVILTSNGRSPGDPSRLLLLHQDAFEPSFEGYAPSWINPTQFIFQDEHRCIRKATLGEVTSTRVLCGAFFEQAASPDGRYIVAHVPATQGPLGLKDTKELRLIDAQTGRHVRLWQGAPPYANWVSPLAQKADHASGMQ